MKQAKDIQSVEERRQLKQNEVDSSKSKLDRNKLGQFSTPRQLADELLLYAKTLRQFDEVNFFDPAFGMGSFYTALLKAFGQKANALGFEVDKDYFAASSEVWKECSELKLKNTDFTHERPSEYRKANLLVCNPPYVRHQHLDMETKSRLKAAAFEASGEPLSGLAGLHAYFMLLCHKWLEDDGVAIWLVPSEILEVNYSKSIRNYLLDSVFLDRIHFFDHADGKFDDALVSSCVIVYMNTPSKADHDVKITLGTSFLTPEAIHEVSTTELRAKNKWSKHLLARLGHPEVSPLVAERKLGDLFSIKRGVATGDNSFFVLEKEQALALDIPKKYLRNILPSSRYLKGDVVRLDKDGFLDTEKKFVLLDVDLPMKQIKVEYPKLYAYLHEGIERGVDKGYLASRREPWYSQEKRNAPSYFVRYMNRETKSGNSHHTIFIKNESDAIAANSYLMLYEKPVELLSTTPTEKDIWSFLSKGLDKTLYRYGRTYGGGLVKFEPNELKEIPLFA